MWRLSDRHQLALELDEEPPRNAEELKARLQRLGLGSHYRVRLTTNRTVVVSYSGKELRIHNSFLSADEEVWKAIITFVHGRNRVARNEARRTILEFPVVRPPEAPRRRRRPERTHPRRSHDHSRAVALARGVQRRALRRDFAPGADPHLAPHEEPARALQSGVGGMPARDRLEPTSYPA